MAVAEGTVVGLEKDTDRDGFVLVRVQGIHNPLRVNVTTLERVTSGLAAGDWVRLVEEERNHSSIGILHSIERDGKVRVGFIGLETLWEGSSSQLQMAKPFCFGEFVRLTRNVITPRFPWLRKREGTWATGKISEILPNGCLIVQFPGRFRFGFGGDRGSFLADPDEVERVSFDTCPTLVDKFRHVEDYHWAVRPVTVAFGVLTAMKFGFFVGHSVGVRLKKGRGSRGHGGTGGGSDGQNGGGKSKWLPSPVANMLSREGNAPAVTAR